VAGKRRWQDQRGSLKAENASDDKAHIPGGRRESGALDFPEREEGKIRLWDVNEKKAQHKLPTITATGIWQRYVHASSEGGLFRGRCLSPSGERNRGDPGTDKFDRSEALRSAASSKEKLGRAPEKCRLGNKAQARNNFDREDETTLVDLALCEVRICPVALNNGALRLTM
jgi:hypothetical protein